MVESHTHPPAKAHTTRALVKQRSSGSSNRFLEDASPRAKSISALRCVYAPLLRQFLDGKICLVAESGHIFAVRTTRLWSMPLERVLSHTED
jgi:hypothetical protein